MIGTQQSSASKRKASLMDPDEENLRRLRKKPTACHPCHSRKIKCSGGQPCSNCQKSQRDCSYPIRDEKVTVSSSYIEELLTENDRLREQSQQGASRDGVPSSTDLEATESLAEQRDTARNPLLDKGSWFAHFGSSDMPIHIGEAADTAFATRFRQALTRNHDLKHIPRVHYVTDGRLASLSESSCDWPTSSRARLLVRFALDTIGACYHCVRKSLVYRGLKQHYQHLPTTETAFTCKLWALFALGEAYSSRTQSASEDAFPGLRYFARASRIMGNLCERPQIDVVEVYLLLSLYSLLMNRRYNAYFLASSAVRLALIMGMHLDMPEQQFPDRAAREHRKRVWWTAYVLDRLWASKMGHPVSVQDVDIAVDLPSDFGLSETEAADFLDVQYMNASIRLARISQEIISSIYNRRATDVAFSQRVQKALSNLSGWVGALPEHLQIAATDPGRPLVRPVKWLHLSFNQYVILATRPVLLHVFQAHKELWLPGLPREQLSETVGETALALAEACIRCARHSHRILTDSWIDGSFAIYDYTYTQYLFSSATVLAASSLGLGKADQDDQEQFESACHFLEQLKENGNFAAKEFCVHLDAMKAAMVSFKLDNGSAAGLDLQNGAVLNPTPATSTNSTTATPRNGHQTLMTTKMALAEPSLQDFLSQANLDMAFLDTQIQEGSFQSLYIPMPMPDEEWIT